MFKSTSNLFVFRWYFLSLIMWGDAERMALRRTFPACKIFSECTCTEEIKLRHSGTTASNWAAVKLVSNITTQTQTHWLYYLRNAFRTSFVGAFNKRHLQNITKLDLNLSSKSEKSQTNQNNKSVDFSHWAAEHPHSDSLLTLMVFITCHFTLNQRFCCVGCDTQSRCVPLTLTDVFTSCNGTWIMSRCFPPPPLSPGLTTGLWHLKRISVHFQEQI